MRAFLFSTHCGFWRALLLGLAVLALGGLRPQVAHATHLRAGDIQSKVDTITGNPKHIYFKLTLYCDPANQNTLQTTATLLFGDGTNQESPRAQNITVNSLVHIYTYYFDHIYPGPKSTGYTVQFVGENRVGNVLNINGGNSLNQTFYISSVVYIDPALGLNHSPVLRAPAVDMGAVNQVYLHNPSGYDADGDSLAFTKMYSQQVPGGLNTPPQPIATPAKCLNYVFPDDPGIKAGAVQVAFEGIPVGNPANVGVPGSAAVYQQDVHNGQIVWNAPAEQGFYNVAMVVEEWRRYPRALHQKPRLIGTIIRDIQIIIQATNNLRPQITVPPDVCVRAGQPVTLTVSATDGSGPGAPATAVTLFAYSGILPPATFVQNGTGTSVTGTFKWTPDCSNVRDQPYSVLFKVQDGPLSSTTTLIDEKPVQITVVGPPPQNLKAQVLPNATAVLSWDKYVCSNADSILIFRRDTGCYAYTPGNCDTGLPAGSGYKQVGAVKSGVTTFSDNNGGAGLSRGVSYSYRIYARFPQPGGSNSVVSNEACLQLAGRTALLTNVDVNSTSATGQLTVKWTRPRTDNGDTLFTKPYGYRLSRATATGAFTQVADLKNNLADTTFVDSGLNTDANQYRYQLVFYRAVASNGTTTELDDPAVTATSVRVTLVPNGDLNNVTVNFAYAVPWDNSKLPAKVFRRTGTTGTYTQIGTVTPGATAGTYLDADPALQRNQTYCYYVQTAGQYATPTNSGGGIVFNNLLNKSQETCVVLRPTPCTPVLSLRPVNCDSLAAAVNYFPDKQTYQNLLTWTIGSTPTGCAVNAVYYRIYRAATSAGPFAFLDSTQQMSYVNRPLTQQSYCYQVQAVSATGERSALSNVACQNECVFFVLPNIFIPGSDVAANRVFRPKTSSPIARTHIQIFNRWGRKVYESDQDPYINWTGGGVAGESSTSGLVSDGIYYYLAEVTFADANHTQKVYKGWVEKH